MNETPSAMGQVDEAAWAEEGEPPEVMLSRIGPYRIEARLGAGAMGVVYRAAHVESGAPAALKTVRVPLRGAVAGLRAEIHALSRIEHPGIVHILDEGLADDPPWYAMELLEGIPLDLWITDLWRPFCRPSEIAYGASSAASTIDASTGDVVRQTVDTITLEEASASALARSEAALPAAAPDPTRGSRPPAAAGRLQEALTLVRRICSPLAFMHGAGIVHRDLKPGNVLLRKSGQPAIVDFGLVARAEGAVGREVVEILGHVCGTVSYIAPEQIQALAVDARCDLYALGCILYEVVTGRTPFLGGSPGVMMSRHLHEAPRPPSELCSGVPPALDTLVLRLLSKDRRERIGHAEDVEAMLAELGADDPGWNVTSGAPAYLFRPQLAGRGEVIDQIANRLGAARKGDGGIVFVGGESGVGKSYMATAVARRAVLDGMRVVSCECVSVATEIATGDVKAAPLHVFRHLFDAIADQCRERGAEEGDRILGARGKILAAFEPSLARLPGQDAWPDPPPLPAQAARARVERAMAEVLAAFVESQPLLLIIDDAQWADELSLAVLESLARGTFLQRPLLVLGTFRSEEIRAGLAALLAVEGVQRIDLGRLDEKAIGALVGDMLAMVSPPAALVGPLARRSAGNPFFAAEYLRTAVAERLLVREDGRWRIAGTSDVTEAAYEALPLPRSLRDLIGRRLSALSPAASALVEAAAVLGRESDGVLLLALEGRGDAIGALKELLARQVLEEVRGDRFRFVHDKLREFTYERIEPSRRRALHATAAAQIERRYTNTSSFTLLYAELAHHFSEAGDVAKAIDYLEAAAELALRNFNNREAAGFLTDALAADDARGRSAPPLRRAAWERKLGLAWNGIGKHADSQGALHRAVALLGYRFPATRPRLVLALLREVLVQLAHRVRQPRQGGGGDADRERVFEAARAFDLLVPVTYFVSNDVLRILYATIKNLNLSERAGPSPELALAYGNAQVAASLVPWQSLAARYGQRMEAVLDSVADAGVRCWAYMLAGTAWGSAGNFDRALHYGHRAVELADQLGFKRRREEGLGIVGAASTHLGDFALHRDVGAEIYESALRGDRQSQFWGLVGEAHARVCLGDLDDGLRLAREAVRLVPENNPPDRILALGVLAFACLRAGLRDEARATAERWLVEEAAAAPTVWYISDGYSGVGEVLLTLWQEAPPGPDKGALHRLAERAVRAIRRSMRIFPARVARGCLYQGKMAAATGHRRRARQLYERGMRSARALRLDFEEGLLRLAMAELLDAADPARREHLERARATFTARGATFECARADALLS